MTWFIFAGDMLVMAFMAALAVWVLWGSESDSVDEVARIPLQDESDATKDDPADG